MDLSPTGIIQLGIGFWGPKTLLSAVELGVFSVLAAGPLDAEELRERLWLRARSTRDFFEAYVESFQLGGRLLFHPGDFFQDPLPAAEVLAMGRVLHDWDLDEKKMLLANA
jgi:O-methyltransferase domain/Dimerisation domain